MAIAKDLDKLKFRANWANHIRDISLRITRSTWRERSREIVRSLHIRSRGRIFPKALSLITSENLRQNRRPQCAQISPADEIARRRR